MYFDVTVQPSGIRRFRSAAGGRKGAWLNRSFLLVGNYIILSVNCQHGFKRFSRFPLSAGFSYEHLVTEKIPRGRAPGDPLLIILCLYFKEALGMGADRTDCRGLFPNHDMAAVPAHPHHLFTLFKDLFHLHVLKKL